MTTLQRTTFETNRTAEYFDAKELQAQTGQPIERFAAVILKELFDNALDACETRNVAPILLLEVIEQEETTTLCVTDNGSGLPSDVVERILNFQTRTSDKAAYRSPSRGAQGNALKTIIGIPYALGVRAPIVITAQGIKHVISVRIDPAGELNIHHERQETAQTDGTRIEVTLPTSVIGCAPEWWTYAFALANPHALVQISKSEKGVKHANTAFGENGNLYQSSVSFPGKWRKFLPNDLTSAHWYDAQALKRLVFAYVAETQRSGKDLLLRDFVRQFRGLSSTAKAKAVCDAMPGIGRLSDFSDREADVETLLCTMQAQAQSPSAGVMGQVGPEHFQTLFHAAYGVKRFWYEKASGEENGIPFFIEIAVAETERYGRFFPAVNFSPTFEDPTAGTLLATSKVSARGVKGFHDRAHASPEADYYSYEEAISAAVAFHLVCPVLEFMDRGKTRLKLNERGSLTAAIAQVLGRVTRKLYEEGEQRKKDAARASRTQQNRSPSRELSLKDIVFHVLPEAITKATGNGIYPTSARSLYYQVRPLIQPHTSKDLDYDYFAQTLLTEYRETNGDITGLYYDPRGYLYEPHSGVSVALGTREVNGYKFPSLLYNKILYVEKKGLWPVIKAAKLAERYDMAIVAAEGYANEAVRTLFERADQNANYQIFVLHDADPYGYNIARTLREATKRMPDYAVDVVDIGLHIEDAVTQGLQTETFTRRKELPKELVLTPKEKEYFEGHLSGRNQWICQRVELNAFSSPDLIAHIERKLAEAGAIGKVIPEGDELADEVDGMEADLVSDWVDEALRQYLSLDDLKADLTQAFTELRTLDAHTAIVEAFETNPKQSWREALKKEIRSLLYDHADDLTEELKRAVVANMQEGEE